MAKIKSLSVKKQGGRRIKKSTQNYRIKANEARIEEIIDRLGYKTNEEKQVMRRVLQGAEGLDKKITLRKTRLALKQVKENKFNLRRRVARFPEIKEALLKDPTDKDLLQTIIKGNFYWSNRDLILQKNAGDKGAKRKLSNAWQKWKIKEISL